MKKKLLCLIAFLGLIVLAAFPAKASAYEYELNGYDVNIRVEENNILHITETIQACFYVSKHGIYRYIPLKNNIRRFDGSSSVARAKVKNVTCSEEFTTSISDDNYVIKIGDKDVTLTGDKSYTISYDYELANDTLKGKDEFYFNMIGTGWTDTQISNVTFSIDMPKEFDQSKLGFSWGSFGTANSLDVPYDVEGNTIRGSLASDFVLGPSEGLTVRLELPDGYFVPRAEDHTMQYVNWAVALIGLLISFTLWMKVGRDRGVVERVEFTPPEDRNSVEIAFLHKGELEEEDVVSLLLYLANKGYLRIDRVESHGLFRGNKEFSITKVKDYDGTNEEERLFMSGLFMSGNVVTKADLRNKFYITVSSIVELVNSKQNKCIIFEKNSINKGWIPVLFTIVSIVLATVLPLLDCSGSIVTAVRGAIFPCVGLIPACLMIFGKSNWPTRLFAIVWCLGLGGIPSYMLDWPVISQNPYYLASFIIAIVCSIGMMFFMSIMSKRTEYGADILGRTRGFKQFIEIAERERLEALVEENPSYFYDILPYAYIFGISDKWIKNFEYIVIEPPEWSPGFGGNGGFQAAAFSAFMMDTMSSASVAMNSSPSSSSGSGGGFSGGGGGGGGGGSW